jgi:hypothetical protein
MVSGTNHDFNRTNLAIESVICEVIDNSKDACDRAGTKKIDIVFYPGESSPSMLNPSFPPIRILCRRIIRSHSA